MLSRGIEVNVLWHAGKTNNYHITACVPINNAFAAKLEEYVFKCQIRQARSGAKAEPDCISYAVIMTDGEYVKTLVTRALTPCGAINAEQKYSPHELSPLVIIRGTWVDMLSLRHALAKTFSIYKQRGGWFDILHFFGAKSVSPEMNRIFNSVLRDSGVNWNNTSFYEPGNRGKGVKP